MIVSVLISALIGLIPLWGLDDGNPTGVSFIIQSELDRSQFVNIADSTFGSGSAESIYTPLGIYRLDVSLESRSEAITIFEKWKKSGICIRYQKDTAVKLRGTVPNDPLYGEQWDMDRIDCQDAWDITTGGVTSTGDTIVVAVLDAGFDLAHNDLLPNVWVNRNEIPGDGIDNDVNGYIDDYRGYYTSDGGDDHPLDPHGVSVSGIVGARGNNNNGVTGVNWHVKLMSISGISTEAAVIEAYQYARKMRELWNNSNGAQGAFVVTTNLSAGISGAFPEDHPMWCAIYDDLGSLGILNVSSVTNSETNVDEDGDIPTTCGSPYLVTVTNTDRDDVRVQPSGFGEQNVDLGAPGSGTFTTTPNNNFSVFGGTSGAAPHVAGTIALMYSVDCADIMNTVLSDPPAAALRMRNTLLSSVNPLNSLENTTSSGGRLDVGDAVSKVCDDFMPRAQKLEFTRAFPNPTRGNITLEFTPESYSKHRISIYDAVGRLVQEETIFPQLSPESHEISIVTQVPGLYFAVVRSARQQASIRFVIM